MARTDRLLSLLQLLRQYRHPVTAQILAEQLQVSIRTIYRDIATLQAQGANIEGEAGLGFQLRPGYLLPPPDVHGRRNRGPDPGRKMG